jgi:RTX calcium-binding nonapeptide repeat (4 copies)
VNAGPTEIVAGADGNLWFTEFQSPGRVGRVNGDGTVTELTGGVTPGFSASAAPTDITTGPDGRIWFTEQAPPGRVARVNGDGSVTEFPGGATLGFRVGTTPTGITAGPDQRVWFTEQADSGGVAAIATPPEAVTGEVRVLSPTQARVSGTVNPEARVTTVHVEYRRVGGAFSSSTPQQAATGAEGPTSLPVSTTLSGLAPRTTFEYRLVATNAAGVSAGTIRTFTTPASAGALGRPSARCAGRRATIVGTQGADRLRGTRRADVIAGLAGDDVIRGLGGRDLICGGPSRDRLLGGPGRDSQVQ